jgi:hypothetical protein
MISQYGEEGIQLIMSMRITSFKRSQLAAVVLAFALMVQPQMVRAGFGDDDSLRQYPIQVADTSSHSEPLAAASTSGKSVKLEGKAEVQQQLDPYLAAWQASQAYRQGVAALGAKDYNLAAEFFKQAGDGFESSLGEGRHLAEARFAEAQARRLLKQNAQAAKLFAIAVDLLRKYEPGSPFLKAAVAYLNGLTSKTVTKNNKKPLHGQVTHVEPKLQALPALSDMVDRHVVLKGHVTQLDDGTKIAALKDNEFFTGGTKRLLSEAAAVDVGDPYVHDTIYKAFAKMNCLEWAELGGNIYTAPESYTAFKSGGKTVIVGASDQFWGPVIQLTIHGHEYGICMDLPGMSQSSHNVVVVTDGLHVLAIDPRNYDTWKLTASFSKKKPDFSWVKLTHVKKGAPVAPGPRLKSPAEL